MRGTCLDKIYEMAQQDERIFFVGSDLGFETLKDFREEIPDRFIMEGINEAHAVGMASGLAMEGKIVYVNTIATFLTRRCFEQVVLDMCMHSVNVRLIGNGGGVVYAPLGPTHLAFEDIALFRALPNMAIIAPADADEMKRLMPLTVDHPGPIYIRLAKGYDPIVTTDEHTFRIGKGFTMREGADALLVTTGITLKLAMGAAESLSHVGIECTVLHMPTIKPLDIEKIIELATPVRMVVTIEEHSIIGGLGSAVAEIMAETNWSSPKRFKRLGIPDVFPEKYGTQASLMEYYNISEDAIINTVQSFSAA
jgi:transketolase